MIHLTSSAAVHDTPNAPEPTVRADIGAALIGALAAVTVLAVMRVLLTSGIAGIDILEPGKLEPFAFATLTTAIVVVFAAFFCGGWVHRALSQRDKQARPERAHHTSGNRPVHGG